MMDQPYSLFMPNYENALATKILATHCACCSRPLVDAVSVQMGIGPDCRKKYMSSINGLTSTVDGPESAEAARAEANGLVYRLALLVSAKQGGLTSEQAKAATACYSIGGAISVGAMLADGTEGAPMLERLRALGFNRLADKLEAAYIQIKIERKGNDLYVKAPFNPDALPAWQGLKGRHWDKALKVNIVPVGSFTLQGPDTNSAKLWALLKRFYAGSVAVGPKGLFVVGAAS